MSVKEPYPGEDDNFLDYFPNPYDLDLLFDCVLLEEPFYWLDLESLTNHTHYIDCEFPSKDSPSASNCPTSAS